MPKTLTILGSTGSIGRQTLDIVRKFPREFRVVGLAAGSNWQLLARQVLEFHPRVVAIQNSLAAEKLRGALKRKKNLPQILVGEKGILDLARRKVVLVVSAFAGVAGLAPTLAAIEARNDVALANKESLVLAGTRVMRLARKKGVRILPLDSEHSAVWQILNGENAPTRIKNKTQLLAHPEKIRRIILTASGGALRDVPLARLKSVTPKQVLAHPTWSMGAKVTVDSATLANKAFEVIEAHHLFGLPYEKIEIAIHPESLVHALVEFSDGSLGASLATPDMRLPIEYALFAGIRNSTRTKNTLKKMDFTALRLNFFRADEKRYPLFRIILDAAKKSDRLAAIAAEADELAVGKFLRGEISFPEIAKSVARELRAR